MPLPLILGIGAAIAGVTGVGTGIHGAVKMKEANDMMKAANSRHEENIKKFETASEKTNKVMDKLGKTELYILQSFSEFSDVIEKIQNRPQFKEYARDDVKLPKYDKEELKQVSVGAGVILGGLGGAATGTAGGLAAAGVTTSAVMALGTASTGTAIASLRGAAATNATLAALGGGAIGSSATAGGMALGTTILGATTLGVGLLVGGVIFNFTGGKLSDKSFEAYGEMLKAEETINRIVDYLKNLEKLSREYKAALTTVNDIYNEKFNFLKQTVESGKTDWNDFTEIERVTTENTVLLVGLLYKMCKVNLVNKAEKEDEMNTINEAAVKESINSSEKVLAALQ